MHYKPTGVCSQNIEFDIEDNKVKNVHFIGGCNGNLQGIARLVEGMDVQEVIDRVEGIQSNAEKLTRFFKKILNFLKFFQIQLFSSQLSTDNAFHNLQILQQTCDCYNFLLHIPLL